MDQILILGSLLKKLLKTQRYQISYQVTQKSMRPDRIQILCPLWTGPVERLGTDNGKNFLVYVREYSLS